MHTNARVQGELPRSDDEVTLQFVQDLAGTPVDDVDGRPVGELFGSLAEEASGLIRYLDTTLRGFDRHVLIPIGHARLEQRFDSLRIRLRAARREELAGIPAYEPPTTSLDELYQREILSAHARSFSGERYYAHPAYDHSGLFAGEHPIVREDAAAVPVPGLVRLSELPGHRVTEGESDIRGWTLVARDGGRVGHVLDLVVDVAAGKARYALATLDARHKDVLLPVGFLEFGAGEEKVNAPALSIDDLYALPQHHAGPITRQDEEEIRAVLERRIAERRWFDQPDFRSS